MPLARRTALRYLTRGVLAVSAVLLLAIGVLAFAGGRHLSRTFDSPRHGFVAATGAAAVAEGERLSAYWGCTGCHGPDGAGRIFFQSPVGDRLIAPNLTRIVREYDDAALERAIRHGVRPDGSSLLVMPSSMYAHMSDHDLGQVVAYLRSLPPVRDTLPATRLGLLARFLVLSDDRVLEAPKIDPAAAHGPGPDSLGPDSSRADTLALGRYLALTGCPECHGPELGGYDGDTPDLRITAAYSLDQFVRFATDGTALDGEERGLMTDIAIGRIGRLTEPEIAALHTYLRTLAD